MWPLRACSTPWVAVITVPLSVSHSVLAGSAPLLVLNPVMPSVWFSEHPPFGRTPRLGGIHVIDGTRQAVG